MRDLAGLLLHLLATVARLGGPGGARAVVAESVLVNHQRLILNRSRKRSPNLRPADRVVAGLCAAFMRPSRLIRSAVVFKPATLLNLHRALMAGSGFGPNYSKRELVQLRVGSTNWEFAIDRELLGVVGASPGATHGSALAQQGRTQRRPDRAVRPF